MSLVRLVTCLGRDKRELFAHIERKRLSAPRRRRFLNYFDDLKVDVLG